MPDPAVADAFGVSRDCVRGHSIDEGALGEVVAGAERRGRQQEEAASIMPLPLLPWRHIKLDRPTREGGWRTRVSLSIHDEAGGDLVPIIVVVIVETLMRGK